MELHATLWSLPAALSLSVPFVRQLDRDGRIPEPVRFGRAVRWSADELAAWARAGCPRRAVWSEIREVER